MGQTRSNPIQVAQKMRCGDVETKLGPEARNHCINRAHLTPDDSVEQR